MRELLIPNQIRLYAVTSEHEHSQFGKTAISVVRRTCYVEEYMNFFARVSQPVSDLLRKKRSLTQRPRKLIRLNQDKATNGPSRRW